MKKIALMSALLLLTACSNFPTDEQSITTSNSNISIDQADTSTVTTTPIYSTPTPSTTTDDSEMINPPQPLSAEQNLAEFKKAAKLLNITNLEDCERAPNNLQGLCLQSFQPAPTESAEEGVAQPSVDTTPSVQ